VLKACKIFHWKQWQGPMSQPPGVSDILGIYQGRMLAIEVKKEGWKPPTPGTKQWKHYQNQIKFMNNVIREGGISFFAQSVEEVIEKLDLGVTLYPLFNNCKSKGESENVR